MAARGLCQRTLSTFKSSAQRWTPVVSHRRAPHLDQDTPDQPLQQQDEPPLPALASPTYQNQHQYPLSLVSWNIDAFSPRPVARARLLISEILSNAQRTAPDVVFLQEVTADVRAYILSLAIVRTCFVVTDAEDRSSFAGVPFANMTLLSNTCFASAFADDAAVSQKADDGKKGEGEQEEWDEEEDIMPPPPPSSYTLPMPFTRLSYRLINTHLDSLGHTLPERTQQLALLTALLRAPDCTGGLIAGDFNAIFPEDHALVEQNGLVDAWLALRCHQKDGKDGKDGKDRKDAGGVREGSVGATWGLHNRRHSLPRNGRLDKVALLNVHAEAMEILRPGTIEVPKPGGEAASVPWSDHCGLRVELRLGV